MLVQCFWYIEIRSKGGIKMNTEVKENKELILFEDKKIRRQEYKG